MQDHATSNHISAQLIGQKAQTVLCGWNNVRFIVTARTQGLVQWARRIIDVMFMEGVFSVGALYSLQDRAADGFQFLGKINF